MEATTMADFTANNTVATSGLEHLAAKAVDTVLSFSPTVLFFLGHQKPWKGIQLRMPIKYAQNSQGMSFSGLEKFSTTKTNNFVNMTFNPTAYEMPTVISQIEVDVAETNKVTDLVARQLASDAQDMASDIATLFYTLQTGNAFLSILDGVDDATNVATYGGLARATYTGLKGSYTASIGNLTLTNLNTSFNACIHGADSPDLITTSKAVWGYFEKLLTPTLSNQVTNNTLLGYSKFTGAGANGAPNIVAPGTQLKGYQGFNAIFYRGVPIVMDEAVPSGNLFMLNTRSWGFYGVPSSKQGAKPIKFQSDTLDSVYNVPVTTGFSLIPFVSPADQYGQVAHIILEGNLICNNPRLNARMLGITGS